MTMLRYIERKSDFNDNGPAWIGRVVMSRSARTVYFNGKAFKRGSMGSGGNYFDAETGDSYWISGVKKNGQDRHWAGSGKITIEAAAVDEYLAIVGASKLDSSGFIVSQTIRATDVASLHDLANEKLAR